MLRNTPDGGTKEGEKMETAANQIDTLEQRVTRKVRWRFIPLLLFLYIIAYIDRNNLGYIALDMNKALGISPAAFGMLSGIFSLGYVPCEIPSNILLHRFGARKWFCRIMVTWGFVVILTGMAHSIHQMYILRVLLGAAEAGFLPGVILYMSFWFTPKERARAVAFFMAALPLSNFIGAPIATSIMHYVHWFGIEGWRWVFILEGVPAVLMGIFILWFLTDRPEQATWLPGEERNWLVATMQREHQAKVQARRYSKWQAFTSPRVLRLAVIYLTITMTQVGLGYWLPTIIKRLSATLTNREVGLIAMGPYLLGAITMLVWSHHSDRTGERRFHTAIGPLIAATGLILFGVSSGLVFKMLSMTVALMGIYSFFGPFWSLPAQFLSEESAAVGIATINSIATTGSFIGPYIIGYVTGLTGNPTGALYVFAAGLFLAFILVSTMHKTATRDISVSEKTSTATH